MIRYKIEEICGDWAIYEVWETETEGGERCLLVLNSRANAEYIKAILEHEARYPNAAVPYRPEVAQMSDAECVAVNRLCCTGGNQCHACPFSGSESLEETCFEVERRVLEMAEKWLELKKEPVLAHHPKPYEKEIEELTCDMCDSCREAVTREDCPNHCCDDVCQHAEALYARGWRRQSEVVRENIEIARSGAEKYINDVTLNEGIRNMLSVMLDDFIAEFKKKYIGGKTDEDIGD